MQIIRQETHEEQVNVDQRIVDQLQRVIDSVQHHIDLERDKFTASQVKLTQEVELRQKIQEVCNRQAAYIHELQKQNDRLMTVISEAKVNEPVHPKAAADEVAEIEAAALTAMARRLQ